MTPVMLTVALAAGGLVGGFLHAWFMGDTGTLGDVLVRKETWRTVFLGVVVGALYPLYPLIPFSAEANTVQKAALVALIAFTTGGAIQTILPTVFSKITGNGVTK